MALSILGMMPVLRRLIQRPVGIELIAGLRLKGAEAHLGGSASRGCRSRPVQSRLPARWVGAECKRRALGAAVWNTWCRDHHLSRHPRPPSKW